MRLACEISQEALMAGGQAVRPGATTWDIDKAIYDYIVHHGAKPNFKGLYGFPGTACISVNDEVIHGIPAKKVVLKEGDIVSIDTGAAIHGWNGDNAYTFACGEVSQRAKRIMEVTQEALARGIAAAQPGNRVGDISAAVQEYVCLLYTSGTIRITLKYTETGAPVISGIRRVSKPGLRIYSNSEELPKVMRGLGTAIISTSKGVMTDKAARAQHVGGEVLAFVW